MAAITQTHAMLRGVLPRNLADIAHEYVCTRDLLDKRSWMIAIEYGYFELCMPVLDYSYAAFLACRHGHLEIARWMAAREPRTMAVTCPIYSAGVWSYNECLSEACSNGHADCVAMMIDLGATYCTCRQPIRSHIP